MSATLTIRPEDTLSHLATTLPGASRVFHRHGLDFCCNGRRTLAEACGATLDVSALAAEISAEAARGEEFERWDERPLVDLVDHILERYHAPLREELPRLVAMARKVEGVHAEKPTCPRGLGDLLDRVANELELHMQKEEQILFPAIREGMGHLTATPIQVMEQEHEDVGADLGRLRELTGDHVPPAEACGTWTALYLGLVELELELMRHIHLENGVLFPRALRA